MDHDRLNGAVSDFMSDKERVETGHATGVPGLVAFEAAQPTQPQATVYPPLACLTLQGSKELVLGGQTHRFSAGQTVVVGHDLPVTTRIADASPRAPYRALVYLIDMPLLRSLYDQISDTAPDATAPSVTTASSDPAFSGAMARYFALRDDPDAAAVLGPLIRKELHFHLLRLPQAAILRRLLSRDSHDSRIARAIAHLRDHFRNPLSVADLAGIAGMGASSFHAHFRAATQTTPLQYQKELRLLEARRLMTEDRHSVSAAAFGVGYESATQFSREYARKFGAPPSVDARAA